MESVTKHGLYEMQKYSVKRGTNKCHHNNRKLGRVNFIIGCGTKYFSMGEPIAKQIGQQVKDGSLDNITGEKFGWWIIWRKEYKDIKSSRNRRQVEGSGDDDNDDYEEDNYEYDDEEDAVQESATDIPTTTTHAHRHHHGDNSAQNLSTTRLRAKASTSLSANGYIENGIPTVDESMSVMENPENSVKTIKEILSQSNGNKPKGLTALSIIPINGITTPIPVTAASAAAITPMPTPATTETETLISITKAWASLTSDNNNYNNSNSNVVVIDDDDGYLVDDANERIPARTMAPLTTTIIPTTELATATTTATTIKTSTIPLLMTTLKSLKTEMISTVLLSSSPSDYKFNNKDGNIDVKTTPEDAEEYEDSAQSLSSTVQTDFESSSSNPTLSYTSGGSTTSTVASSTIAETTTTTTAVPDYVEPKIENSPPIIKLRLQKLAVTSGKSFKFTIPDDTFYDNEDMNNLRLEITDKDGHELKTNSWLQFNSEAREIYGLPLDDAVSKWQYRLTATDSGNESVTETVEISVQQHRGVRTVNHEINIAVKINEKNIHYIDWQLKLIEAIATTMGDNNTKSIVVREIRQTSQDPHTATLVYFNETVPTNQCPESELNNLVKHLDAQRLSDLVHPILGIKSITGQLTGPCQKIVSIKPKTPSISAKNSPPVPRNQVDRVVATTGHLLVYKVPSDTFFDPNDNELKLNLKTKDNKDLNPRHWLQFDVKNHEFYGIPKGGDIGPEEYLLVAEDSGGLTATDALVVQVNHAPKREFSVYFKIYLAIRHEQFNADLQRKFVERIAQLFGDGSTQNIQIRSVTTHHDADGTIVNFYNTTLFKMHNRCPEEEIEMARNVYLDGHAVRDKVKKLMGPELNVTNVQVSTLGICNPQTDVTHREFIPNRTEEPLLRSTFSDDYMFTIIMPAIIIVVMVLVAAIIACCLHRRRRKSGKMELDEKPEIGNKSPIILKDEKPPLLPPSYNTSNMNGDNDVDEYVPPPAVVVGGREARGKSPATPSYRKPPPYVSP
uniref:Dystroglycan 1 n=1 Tax=Glossina austeni TaxID=7395 RepID=A0A1A9VY29_GLOAU